MKLFLITTVFAVAHASSAQAPPSSPHKISPAPIAGRIDSAELASFVDTLITAQMKQENIPGAVFLLVKDGKVLYQRGYGFANVARRQAVDPAKTIWRIGSISKVFTATAVVQLADRGRFRLSDDVNRYLTRFKVPPTYPEPVTFQHLLTHTAGFDEIRPGTRAETAAGVLPLGDFLATKLVRLRPPGQTISYSTYGITLAGYLVEQVSGMEFETYLARNVWGPLGMTRTSITVPDSLKRDLALGYEYEGGANKLADWEWYHTIPASSINATAADMGRFIIAHLQNGQYGNTRIMSASAASDMHRQHVTSHQRLAGFAYGFYEEHTNGEQLLEHGGNVEGFSAQLTLIPARGIGFFIASQHEPARLRDVVQSALLDHYFPAPPPVPPTPMPGYRERAARFAGTYELNQFCHTCGADRREYPRIEVKSNSDGTISITGNPQPLVEVSPSFFRRLNGTGGGVAFRADASGRVNLLAGDSWIVFERIK
ncbi:MAG TPA: serine hydrolase domain-containing protein [Gemmatimonadaceae bacterium]|nr:serine hydrolase domain-containing protein [Gemmatimonadaceae bacterium]